MYTEPSTYSIRKSLLDEPLAHGFPFLSSALMYCMRLEDATGETFVVCIDGAPGTFPTLAES